MTIAAILSTIATILGLLATILLVIKPALRYLAKRTKNTVDDEILEVAVEVAENIPKAVK